MGRSFDDLRDTALLRVLIDTGARASEIMGLKLDAEDPDIDLDEGIIPVMGKGRRPRFVGLGAKSVKALDRYVKARARPLQSLRRSGSASRVRSRARACARCSSGAARRRGSKAFTRIRSGTPSRTSGCSPVVVSRT